MTETLPPYRRILAFAELVKPELTGLVVLSAVLSYLFASESPDRYVNALLLALGSFLVGGGAASLNQVMERRFDHLMRRTEHRPIPSGRISPRAAALFGIVISLGGVWVLWYFFGSLPGILGLVTLAIYLALYTPLKRRSPWNTLVGAFPGALPTLIGWSAAEGTITLGGWMVFTILFLWQFPHFFSLAWMYRKDYARAGYKMLPVIDDEQGTRTNTVNILSVIGLLVVTSSMTAVGITGLSFLGSSLVLGLGFLWAVLSVRAVQRKNPAGGRYPRRLFYASLAYLPLVLLLGLLDKVQ